MSRIDFEPWEPEETVGKLWHAFASRLDGHPVHDGARVHLSQVSGRLAVLFRGLGGDPAVEVKPVAEEISHHRLSLLRRLGTWRETAPRASFDGASLRLPESLAIFPAVEANAALYLWLAVMASAADQVAPPAQDDPLLADLAAIEVAAAMTKAALEEAPGFARLHRDLAEATLMFRRSGALPPVEAAVEARVRRALGDLAPLPDTPLPAKAPRGYRPFRPVPIWPDLRALPGRKRRRSRTATPRARPRILRGKDRPPRAAPQGRSGGPQRQLHPAQVRGDPVDDRIPQPQPPGRGR
ncbi:MAG: hypothetical protein R3D46_15880 [Defluviimonas denitrificans]